MLTQDLEQIYELTYKYQILRQEEARGGYGSPQVLSDRASVLLLQTEDKLRRLLSRGISELEQIFSGWVTEHESVVMTDVEQDIEELLEEGSIEERSQLSGIPVEELGSLSVDEIMRDMRAKGIIDDVTENSEEMKKVRHANDILLRLNAVTGLSDAILLFQEALHFSHFNGLLVDKYKFVEDADTNTLLKNLSNLPSSVTDKWDRELARVLGYAPGSRLSPKESFLQLAVEALNGRDRSFSEYR